MLQKWVLSAMKLVFIALLLILFVSGLDGFAKAVKGSLGLGLGLDPKAQSALKRANGDINIAQKILFQEKLEKLSTEDPVFFEDLVEKKKQQAQLGVELEGDVHEKLVELSWDVIADFITESSSDSLEEDIKMKCRSIASACIPADKNGGTCAVLDVGCGDGALLPYLMAAGADQGRYVGLDLSPAMIEKAKAKLKYKKGKSKTVSKGKKEKPPSFLQGNFLTHPRCLPPTKFDIVMLNGVMQFFSTAMHREVLSKARSLLKPGGRILISHVNGGDFVKEEKVGNPATVLSVMPTVTELIALCNEVEGLKMMPDLDEAGLGDFYLVSLEAF